MFVWIKGSEEPN